MRIPALFALLSLATAAPARADVSIDYAIEGDCAVEPAGLKISGSQLRIESGDTYGRGSSIFDGLEDVVIQLDHARRTWYEMEVDLDAADYMGDVAQSSMHYVDREIEKAQAQMQQACKQMESQGMRCPQGMDIKTMMEQARGMAAQAARDPASLQGSVAAGRGIDDAALRELQQSSMRDIDSPGMGSDDVARAMASIAPYADSGRDETIGGLACRWYEQARGEQRAMAQCITPVEQLAIDERDRAGLKRAMVALTRFGDAFGPMMERYGVSQEPLPVSRGLIAAQRCYDARGESVGSAQVAIATQALDESTFEVPAGYSRQRMDGMQ